MPHPYASIFNHIYGDHLWSSGSGPGSTPAATRKYRAYLARFMAQNRVRSVVDLGSGDWQTSSRIDWSGIDYLGVDVSTDIIAKVMTRYARPGIRFAPFESYQSLPEADLLIVKDVLQHLPSAEVHEVLALRKYRSILATNCVEGAGLNADIVAGDFRPLVLAEPPFNVKGDVVLRYGAPLVSGHPRRDIIDLGRRLLGRRRWLKEVFLIRGA